MTDREISIRVSEHTLQLARAEAERKGVSLESWLENALAQAAFAPGLWRGLDWCNAHGFADDPSEELAIEEELAREERRRGVA